MKLFRATERGFDLPLIRYAGPEKLVRKVALAVAPAASPIPVARGGRSRCCVTADLVSRILDAEEQLLPADIGHYENRQFTIDWLFDVLQENFPNFAVLKTGINSNPVR